MAWWMILLIGLAPITWTLCATWLRRRQDRLHREHARLSRYYYRRKVVRNNDRLIGLGLSAIVGLMAIGLQLRPLSIRALLAAVPTLVISASVGRYWYRQPTERIEWEDLLFPD